MGEKITIKSLKIVNLHNIELVEVILQDKKWIELRGNKGAGKTTVLNAFWGAINTKQVFGRKAWQVIRKGENVCTISIKIQGIEREYEIKRTITKDSNTLKITNLKNKSTVRQSEIEDLFNQFSVNLFEFSNMTASEQIKAFKDMFNIDTDEIDRLEAKIYDDRKFARKDMEKLQAVVNETECEFVEKIDVGSLIGERNGIVEFNQVQSDRERKIDSTMHKRHEMEMKGFAIQDEIDDIQKLLDKKNREKELNKGDQQILIKEINSFEKPLPEQDTTDIDNKISESNETNQKALQYKVWKENIDKLNDSKTAFIGLEKRLAGLRSDRENTIKNAPKPPELNNISFDEELGVCVDGVPFSQLSDGEKLEMSIVLAMETNPVLRVLFIDRAESLDKPTLELLKKKCQEKGFQVLLSCIGEEKGDNSILLKEGHVIFVGEEKNKENCNENKGYSETI